MIDCLARREMVTNKTKPSLGTKLFAVEGNDARGLLTAMLERMESEGGDGCRVGMAEYAEDAAFLAQPVGIEIEFSVVRRPISMASSAGEASRFARASRRRRSSSPSS